MVVGGRRLRVVLATTSRDRSGSRTHASRTLPMDLSNPSARTRASRSVPARSAHAFAHSHATDAVDASIEPSSASFNTFDKCNHAAANAVGSEPTLPVSLSTANDRSSRAVRSVWMASWSESAADVSDRARSLARRSPNDDSGFGFKCVPAASLGASRRRLGCRGVAQGVDALLGASIRRSGRASGVICSSSEGLFYLFFYGVVHPLKAFWRNSNPLRTKKF